MISGVVHLAVAQYFTDYTYGPVQIESNRSLSFE
jgi:hypothetical protein